MSRKKIGGSFRDPSGVVYSYKDEIYRQVNEVYRQDYDLLIQSGLYKALVSQGLLIPHKEIDVGEASEVYKTIKPVQVPFISYPYEWSFSQYKDAALTTLTIQRIALDYGMILRDASAYNIQFYKGKPALIDTLSFVKYEEGAPWMAYRQFCMHFLAPLLLMTKAHPQLNKLLRVYIDGIPLDMASALLPTYSWFKPSILTHIHLHSRFQQKFGHLKMMGKKHIMGKASLLGLIDNLESIIKDLKLTSGKSEWSDYYKDNNYSSLAFNHKKKIVSEYLKKITRGIVWDIGANTGVFGKIASDLGNFTVCFDNDFLAVENLYKESKKSEAINCLPLIFDITNPTPALGWEYLERMSIYERGPADTVLFLALIHHLAIGSNIPMEKVASFLNRICQNLIIEFVPKEDSQVQRLLSSRKDIFKDYNQLYFEEEFNKFFIIRSKTKVKGSPRWIYFMTNKKAK